MKLRMIFRPLAIALVAFSVTGGATAQDARPDLTIAVDNLWPTMDPVIGISTTGQRVHFNVFDTLVRRNRWEDPNGNSLVPWLAESAGYRRAIAGRYGGGRAGLSTTC